MWAISTNRTEVEMYSQRRKRNKRHWNSYTSEALALQPLGYEIEEKKPFYYYLAGPICGALIVLFALVFNFKLPSPFGEVVMWTGFAFAVAAAGLWLWNWNADQAAARRGGRLGERQDWAGRARERKDEDYYVQPLTPEELAGSTIALSKYGKPLELVAEMQPLNMRGYLIQRTPEMDDISDWELFTNPAAGKKGIKYIGTIGEENP
jgi:hypothetical protein